MTTQTTPVPYQDLNDGNRLPQLGFGVFQVPEPDTAEAVGRALAAGYRSIDTAAAYGNEAGVRDGLLSSGLEREDVFITTKLRNRDHGRDRVPHAFEESLERLGGDYVDLYLIHWPIPRKDLYLETWEAMCALKGDGRVRSIGVSNFQIEHLERIIDATGVVPAVNQIELHPRLQQAELRRFHEEHEIATEAWSPLGKALFLDDPTIEEIATAHGRTRRAGRAPLAHTAREHRDPEVGYAEADRGELPDLRLRAGRGRDAGALAARAGRADRPRPRQLRVGNAPLPASMCSSIDTRASLETYA